MTERLSAVAGRLLSLGGSALAIGVPMITVIIYFAQIGPEQRDQASRMTDLKIQQVEQRERFEKSQAEQNARMDRIDESRSQGLQRLAKVEEAVKATKETMDQINAKLDRLLFSRLR